MLSRIRRSYYGWTVVGVLAVASFTQVGEFNPVLAVFIKPFGDEFGWSRAEVSLGITLGSICGGLIGPFVGPLIDKYGARNAMVAAQLVYGTCLLSLTWLNGTLPFFLIAYGLGRTAVQGGASLANQAAIAQWFIRMRGRAMGIITLGTRLGQAAIPPIVAWLVQGPGWRYAFLFLGGIVWVFAIVPTILLVRRRPEDMGLRPDGAGAPTSASGGTATPVVPAEPRSWTRRDALRTRSLWQLTLTSSVGFFMGAGINLHLLPYLTDVGLSLGEAVFAASVFFFIAGFGGVLWGALQDRFPLHICLAAAVSICAIGIVILLSIRSLPAALLFAVVYGIAFGGLNIMTNIMWAVYYGRANVGAISGVLLPLQLLFNAMGPFFGGWIFDVTGNYRIAFLVYLGAAVIGAVSAALTGRPRAARLNAP